MKPTLFFLDGVAPAPDSLVLAAQYNAHADVDASRVLLNFGDSWSKVDFDEDLIRSLAFRPSSGTLYLLGKSGTIYTIGGRDKAFTRETIRKTLNRHQIVDPEERGELSRVRVVRDRVFVCGLGGQVYELLDGAWHYIGLKGEATSCPDFEDVAVGLDDVPIAVGSRGSVYRFPSSGPEQVDSPTNQYLSSIIADATGRCFVCGNAGVVLRIDRGGIVDMSVDVEPVRNLWAIEYHEGHLFACEPDRLLVRDADSPPWGIESVSSSQKATFHRLAASNGDLWSFGADHVFVKRAGTWRQVLVPGNEILP